MRRIKEKLQVRTIIRALPTMFLLVFIFYMMVQTCFVDEVEDVVKETNLSFEGLELLSETFEDTLQENFYDKNDYINLNGLTTRILGINSLNERQKLANGYLTDFGGAGDTSKTAANTIALDQFLAERGIDFVYLLAPSKRSFYDVEFAPGYSSDAWMDIDSMISTLDEAGVATIDMDAWFEENDWTFEDVYFTTDHHWRPQAGLAAANVTMELLSEKGWACYQEELLQEDSYTINTLNDWFLGSHGRRVGIFYAGVDDIDVYLPDFDTGYTLSDLNMDTMNWEYHDSILNLWYTENKDYYNSDPYGIYLYHNQPIQIVKNSKALNDKRVLVTGDSFQRVWKYFLATQFQEIYSVDLRYYTDGTFAEYIEEIQPDLVIMCTDSPMDLSLYTFGVEQYLSALEMTSEYSNSSVNFGNTKLTAQENNNHFSVITADLEPGQAYTLTVDATAYSGGEDQYIQMTLQNLSTNEAVYNRYFDANSDELQKWIFTTPDNENDQYAIYLYAGTKDHTQNVAVKVKDIILYRGIKEI